ncbi:hypothetical protein Dimus_030857 [Dionaea muscipula]
MVCCSPLKAPAARSRAPLLAGYRCSPGSRCSPASAARWLSLVTPSSSTNSSSSWPQEPVPACSSSWLRAAGRAPCLPRVVLALPNGLSSTIVAMKLGRTPSMHAHRAWLCMDMRR